MSTLILPTKERIFEVQLKYKGEGRLTYVHWRNFGCKSERKLYKSISLNERVGVLQSCRNILSTEMPIFISIAKKQNDSNEGARN